MSKFDELAGIISGVGAKTGGVTLYSGTCDYIDGKWRVFRGGQEVQAVWVESATPRKGSCLLAVDSPAAAGQSVTYVLGITHESAFRNDDTAVVLTVGSAGTCDVQMPDGRRVDNARYMTQYTPAVGHVVFLLWRGGEAYIMGNFPYGHVPAPPGKTEPQRELPREIGYGASQFPALMHRTWNKNTNTWEANRSRDLRLNATNYAVFIYGGTTKGLSSELTVEEVFLSLGRRIQRGNDNISPVTLNIYRSDAEFMSGVEATLLEGPYNITIPANYDGTPLSLPAELGDAMRQGGSISVTTAQEVTFADSPAMGYLKIKWRKK